MVSMRTIIDFEGGTPGGPVNSGSRATDSSLWVPGFTTATGWAYTVGPHASGELTYASDAHSGSLSVEIPPGRYGVNGTGGGIVSVAVGATEAVGIGGYVKVAPGVGDIATDAPPNINWIDVWFYLGDTSMEILPHQRGDAWSSIWPGYTSMVAFEYTPYATDGQWAYTGDASTWLDKWLDFRLLVTGEWSVTIADSGTVLLSGTIHPPATLNSNDALGFEVYGLGDGPVHVDDVYIVTEDPPVLTGRPIPGRRRFYPRR